MNLLQRIDLANMGTWINCFDELPTVKGDYLVKYEDNGLHVLHFLTHDQGFTREIPNPRWCPDSIADTDYDDSRVILAEDPIEWFKLD